MTKATNLKINLLKMDAETCVTFLYLKKQIFFYIFSPLLEFFVTIPSTQTIKVIISIFFNELALTN